MVVEVILVEDDNPGKDIQDLVVLHLPVMELMAWEEEHPATTPLLMAMMMIV